MPGLRDIVKKYNPKIKQEDTYLLMEFILHGLSEYSMLSKNVLEDGMSFSDLFRSVFSAEDFDENEA